ncbi:hypothetical protein ACLQ25_32450 [Micromonospora sp. DT44]|uniref:hypothetical protein n=1 Tax=Micromonospora sp. DT44 TaxID=3393439 RepID=UPI003CEF76EA
MRKPTPDQLRLLAELASSRTLILEYLAAALGPELSAAQAQAALEQVKAWKGPNAHLLARHLTGNPSALTAPGRDCPKPLVRLLPLLVAAGHGDKVRLAACSDCGRTDPPPLIGRSAGRVCLRCADRSRVGECARCGAVRPIRARRPEGGICQSCRSKEPDALRQCAHCDRLRPPTRRLPDGAHLCQSCAPKSVKQCCRCGRQRRVNARTLDGPVCGTCYTSVPRRCGVCGTVAMITARATDSRPDTCRSCLRRRTKRCSVCGLDRPGHHLGGTGLFHCYTCAPRPIADCGICGHEKPVKTVWALGPVCNLCYRRRRATPKTCSSCTRRRIIVARGPEGEDWCASCSSTDQPRSCTLCGEPGDLLRGTCPRCVLRARVSDLLSPGGGAVPAALEPLSAVLADADNPYRVLQWLRSSPSARLLAQLARQPGELTHDALDAFAPGLVSDYLRGLLVSAGVLPARDENLALLTRWLTRELAAQGPQRSTVIRAFAEWHILRDARRRSTRGRYTFAAYKGDASNIRAAGQFLTWLDQQNLTLDTLNQQHLDTWAAGKATLRARTIPFIRWATARRLTARLSIAHPPTRHPEHFHLDDMHQHELRRCLTDTSLPADVRIAGALTRLYALPLTRIVELTTAQFHRDDDHVYLTISRHPVVLPPSLAQLIQDHLNPRDTGLPGNANPYLLAGRNPGRQRNPAGLADTMRHHGLPARAARNTAMMHTLADLPLSFPRFDGAVVTCCRLAQGWR